MTNTKKKFILINKTCVTIFYARDRQNISDWSSPVLEYCWDIS